MSGSLSLEILTQCSKCEQWLRDTRFWKENKLIEFTDFCQIVQLHGQCNIKKMKGLLYAWNNQTQNAIKIIPFLIAMKLLWKSW